MDKHISQLRKACYFELRRIAQIRSYLSIESANRLVCSLITSKLDYCNSLFAGITDTQINKIQQVQNNAARLVTKTHKREHITPVLKHLHWLPIRHRIEYKIATTAYQCLYEQSYPQYLKNLIIPYTPSRSLRSSTKNMLKHQRTQLKNYGQRALPSLAAKVWNNLPTTVKESPSFNVFKRNIKTHLFRKAHTV